MGTQNRTEKMRFESIQERKYLFLNVRDFMFSFEEIKKQKRLENFSFFRTHKSTSNMNDFFQVSSIDS